MQGEKRGFIYIKHPLDFERKKRTSEYLRRPFSIFGLDLKRYFGAQARIIPLGN